VKSALLAAISAVLLSGCGGRMFGDSGASSGLCFSCMFRSRSADAPTSVYLPQSIPLSHKLTFDRDITKGVNTVVYTVKNNSALARGYIDGFLRPGIEYMDETLQLNIRKGRLVSFAAEGHRLTVEVTGEGSALGKEIKSESLSKLISRLEPDRRYEWRVKVKLEFVYDLFVRNAIAVDGAAELALFHVYLAKNPAGRDEPHESMERAEIEQLARLSEQVSENLVRIYKKHLQETYRLRSY
jgi:hypothetical protein